ncbi:DUF4350 domain-containing protein [Actinomadura harenae]|uniref:DUF4350 domain-containing protein n=1 Tax=Actinomadura harenae TaxID=2483351 RepID=A0A3M2MBU3_9ACTN|nr:DUF4350 domain-containing protein [Actinomadura harenae]RMI46936.1 DUF4350 domain-containing protein [Actinomadura harenae]
MVTVAEPTAGQVAGRRLRSARGIVLVLLCVVVVGVILAALKPSRKPDDLDPESPKPGGTRALAEILKGRGVGFEVAHSVSTAAPRAGTGTIMVVTRPERLTRSDLDRLGGTSGDLLLVEPGRDTLTALAPGVEQDGPTFLPQADPQCALQGATLAGTASFGESETYTVPSGVTACYPESGKPRLVQYQVANRMVTVLGSARPLTNGHLTEEGNAALAMNLVGARSQVIWLIPDVQHASGDQTGDRTLSDLLPRGVKLFFLGLMVAIVPVALWRGRRLGPVVAEALPVVVRSAETVTGRSRLYRAHRARGRAAEALRAGTRDRIVPLLGLPRTVAQILPAQDPGAVREVVLAVAARTDHDERTIAAALYGLDPGQAAQSWPTGQGDQLDPGGGEPVDDAGLLALADLLDDLERQVRQS